MQTMLHSMQSDIIELKSLLTLHGDISELLSIARSQPQIRSITPVSKDSSTPSAVKNALPVCTSSPIEQVSSPVLAHNISASPIEHVSSPASVFPELAHNISPTPASPVEQVSSPVPMFDSPQASQEMASSPQYITPTTTSYDYDESDHNRDFNLENQDDSSTYPYIDGVSPFPQSPVSEPQQKNPQIQERNMFDILNDPYINSLKCPTDACRKATNALVEAEFGLEVLGHSNLTGRDYLQALCPKRIEKIQRLIKRQFLCRFASELEFASAWKKCRTSIGVKCKNVRSKYYS